MAFSATVKAASSLWLPAPLGAELDADLRPIVLTASFAADADRTDVTLPKIAARDATDAEYASAGLPKRSASICRTDVLSSGVLHTPRGANGPATIAGTRTPAESKAT